MLLTMDMASVDQLCVALKRLMTDVETGKGPLLALDA